MITIQVRTPRNRRPLPHQCALLSSLKCPGVVNWVITGRRTPWWRSYPSVRVPWRAGARVLVDGVLARSRLRVISALDFEARIDSSPFATHVSLVLVLYYTPSRF